MRFLTITLCFAAACFAPSNTMAQSALEIEVAFENLSFSRPVDIQHAGDGTDRIFVVEQHTGRIVVFNNSQLVDIAETFLTVGNLSTANEEGLLGLAFHPDYENNGHFFVYYSTSGPRRSVISRFSVDPENPSRADPESELIILEIGQPYSNHNGGQLAFGPEDGFLYIGLGDGGDGGDPDENGEDPKTLLGSILRIDVNNATESSPYAIPEDNPFFDNTEEFRQEIFAYGLRNPWRFSIDPETGNIWAGDVGQGAREEIDLIEKGNNYGWDIMEASLCFEPRNGCSQDGLTLPVWEYSRDLGTSVSGGYVYRGTRIPSLVGKYIYADHVSGRIWALTYDGENEPTNEEIVRATFNVPAFGVSESQELFIAGFNGKIHRLVDPQSTHNEPQETPLAKATLGASYPNPARGTVTIPFYLPAAGEIELAIFDMLGRKVDIVAQGFFQKGDHRVIWSFETAEEKVETLPAGAYFYTLRIEETVAATKMLTLLK